MTEEWRPVKGYEGYYEVSSYGRVKSLSRKVFLHHGGYRIEDENIRKIVFNKGYSVLSLHLNGKRKLHKIHRLVAEAFIPNPDGKPQVNHRDGDKTNNLVENLEWCTSKENIIHSVKNGLKNVCRGEEHYNMKLTNKQIHDIRKMKNKISQRKIAGIYGVSQSHISSIINKRCRV